MDDADLIWNRAAAQEVEGLGPGDRALADALALWGMAQNGGVLHALDVLTAEEVEAARTGFAWLDLEPVADLVADVQDRLAVLDEDDLDAGEVLERSADDALAALLPLDSDLEAAFRRRLGDRPGDFAPADATEEPERRRGWRRLLGR